MWLAKPCGKNFWVSGCKTRTFGCFAVTGLDGGDNKKNRPSGYHGYHLTQGQKGRSTRSGLHEGYHARQVQLLTEVINGSYGRRN